ncbi:IS3 family transposase [Candidatus Vondammii sp. HM_W22]|uniref:IS3 family transposase n=1 Tax=Candidatus Vondammii sp. HM_W22 TaxID=2687299 RepID=UPI00403D6BBD
MEYNVTRLCQTLEVSPSGYYAWRDRPENTRAKCNRQLVRKISLFHKASRKIYGSPRIHQDLVDTGEQIGVNRVARLMMKHGIQSKMAKSLSLQPTRRILCNQRQTGLNVTLMSKCRIRHGYRILLLSQRVRDGCLAT